MTVTVTRRSLLAAALAVPLAAAAPAAAGPPRLTLPAPTGPHQVGVVSLHLVDESRPDGVPRDLMADVWYPARDAGRHPLRPWMAAAPMHALFASAELDADVAAPRTAGHEGAPVLAGRPRPVVVYSHGADGHRSETAVVVQELASRGYIVVTVDHAGDSYSRLPDGRLVVPDGDVPVTPWDHAHDIRFVLDRVEDLAAGRNPDVRGCPLPAGLGAAFDLTRIGMFGWSKGGTATALVMNTDARVRAGLSLDGLMLSGPPPTGIDRPFMLMTAAYVPGAEESGVEEFWPLLHGWRRQVHAKGSTHIAYTVYQWLIPQLAAVTGMSPGALAGWIGELDPAQAVRIQQAYPLAFFDLHLRGRPQPLLDGPSRAHPAIEFVS